MKKSLIAALVAVPALSLSSVSFAAQPVELSAADMDSVTAGFLDLNYARLTQVNASPVTVAQLNILTFGARNSADIASGNFAYVNQH